MPSPAPCLSSPSPLSIEATIKEVFQLYGTKFKDYVKIAFWATLWMWLWLVPTIAVTAFFVTVKNYYALLGLLIPALVVLLGYCSAKYQVNLVLITRLAFGELTHRPESIEEGQRFMRPRMWRLFQSSLILGLLYLGGILLVYLVLIVLAVVAVLAVGGPTAFQGRPTAGTAAAILLLVLLFLAVILLLLVLSLWVGSRVCLYTATIALEPEVKPAEAISRSWSLTRTNVWRIVLVLVVVALAVAPIAGVEQWLALSVQQAFVGPISRRRDPDSGLLLLGTLVSLMLNFGVQILILPLWSVMRASIYRRLTEAPSDT